MNANEMEDLVQFYVNIRTRPGSGHFWYIGGYVPSDKEPELVAESMRGDLDMETRVFRPMQDERRPCCDAVDATKDPFAVMQHCTTAEHIRNMLSTLSEERLKREYDYMLEQVFNVLVGDWRDGA